MRDKFADSNVLLYLFDERKEWAEKALEILNERPVVSTQVINENISVCLRKFKQSKKDALQHGRILLAKCIVQDLTQHTVELAFGLFEK